MRIYADLGVAHKEILRDIYKSDIQKSSRVQGLDGLDLEMREYFNYSYGVLKIPTGTQEITKLAKGLGLIEDINVWEAWLEAELGLRLSDEPIYMDVAEPLHPALGNHKEGNHYGYTYQERMMGMIDIMFNHFIKSEDTRRAFWPIYHPTDAYRGVFPTRVPCTIGYHFKVNHGKMDVTLISRSCDLDRFWISDIYFARAIMEELLWRLDHMNIPEWIPGHVTPGITYHHVISFHSFIGQDEVIF